MLNVFQTRVKEFDVQTASFKEFIANTGVKSFIETTGIFLDGFKSLGLGELYARQSERQAKIDALLGYSKDSNALFNKFNDQGIQRINEAIAKLPQVTKDISDLIKPEAVKQVEEKIKERIEAF